MSVPRIPLPHYPTLAAKYADLAVHLIGIAFALVGGFVMVELARRGAPTKMIAIGIYAGALIAMLTFSLAYNFADETRRPWLRRLDHSGIFLMIAGSYTPFTTIALSGAWAWGMTAAVWTLAIFGILGKLLLPELKESIWIGLYLALGWIVVIALGPMMTALSPLAMKLLAIGGVIYTIGVLFHVNEKLNFSRSIWHGHVVAAAGIHWAAVLIGTVM